MCFNSISFGSHIVNQLVSEHLDRQQDEGMTLLNLVCFQNTRFQPNSSVVLFVFFNLYFVIKFLHIPEAVARHSRKKHSNWNVVLMLHVVGEGKHKPQSGFTLLSHSSVSVYILSIFLPRGAVANNCSMMRMAHCGRNKSGSPAVEMQPSLTPKT